MRVKGANFSPDSGGVLIVTLLLCVVLGILIGSYLSLAKANTCPPPVLSRGIAL